MNNQEYTPALLRSKRALLGSFVHSVSFGEIEMIENGLMIYLVNGTIEALLDLDTTPFDRSLLAHLDVTDYTGKIIMPGFVDAHVHAPQYVFSGTGMDLPLLAWLEKYTFPAEARFSDTDFARLAYSRSIKRHLKCGTTFASYFATIHQPAGKVLVDVLQAVGQRAFVGKVSMDRNSPDFYIEQTQKGCSDAEEFARYVLGQSDLGAGFLRLVDQRAQAMGEGPPTFAAPLSLPHPRLPRPPWQLCRGGVQTAPHYLQHVQRRGVFHGGGGGGAR